jgi:hypothetical protein
MHVVALALAVLLPLRQPDEAVDYRARREMKPIPLEEPRDYRQFQGLNEWRTDLRR